MVSPSVPEPKLGDLRAELAAAGVFETRELRSWFKLAAIGVGGLASAAGWGTAAADGAWRATTTDSAGRLSGVDAAFRA